MLLLNVLNLEDITNANIIPTSENNQVVKKTNIGEDRKIVIQIYAICRYQGMMNS